MTYRHASLMIDTTLVLVLAGEKSWVLSSKGSAFRDSAHFYFRVFQNTPLSYYIVCFSQILLHEFFYVDKICRVLHPVRMRALVWGKVSQFAYH